MIGSGGTYRQKSVQWKNRSDLHQGKCLRMRGHFKVDSVTCDREDNYKTSNIKQDEETHLQ